MKMKFGARAKELTTFLLLSAAFVAVWAVGSRILSSLHSAVVSITLKGLDSGSDKRDLYMDVNVPDTMGSQVVVGTIGALSAPRQRSSSPWSKANRPSRCWWTRVSALLSRNRKTD
jgi:hypothetical protein